MTSMQMSEVPDGVKTMVKNFQETEENLGNREVRLRKALYGYMTSSNCSTTGHTNTSETIGGTLRKFFFYYYRAHKRNGGFNLV